MIRFPMDSVRKRMSTVLDLDSNDESEFGYPKRLHTKGASELVLESCTHYLNEEGVKTPIDESTRTQLNEVILTYGSKEALTTIAFAYKDLKEGEGGPTHDDIQEGS